MSSLPASRITCPNCGDAPGIAGKVNDVMRCSACMQPVEIANIQLVKTTTVWPKWEYKQVVGYNELPLDELNELGSEGWELAGITRIVVRPNRCSYVFKRPLEEARE